MTLTGPCNAGLDPNLPSTLLQHSFFNNPPFRTLPLACLLRLLLELRTEEAFVGKSFYFVTYMDPPPIQAKIYSF